MCGHGDRKFKFCFPASVFELPLLFKGFLYECFKNKQTNNIGSKNIWSIVIEQKVVDADGSADFLLL